MEFKLKDQDKFRFTEDKTKAIHLHEALIDGAWRKVPGCTSISGLFPDDGWKFAWPPKLMAEYVYDAVQEFSPSDTRAGCYQIPWKDFDQILKDGKNAWRKKRDKSADTGTQGHEAIEAYIKARMGGMGDFGIIEIQDLESAEVTNIITEFICWEREAKPKWLASEVQVGSLTNEFAGILDAVAVINGKTVLLDFKTSTAIKDDYSIQLAGLHLCLSEMGFVPDEMAILHLPKEGKYEYRPIVGDLEADKRAFLAGLAFYREKNLFNARCKK